MLETIKTYMEYQIELLESMTRKVPASVNSGSYQFVLDWKDDIKKAQKPLKSRTKTIQQIDSMINRLERYK